MTQETNKNCNSCNSCDYCDSCNYCNSCNSCDYCDYCNSCDSCNSCDYCDYCDSCYYSRDLRMSEGMIFCIGEGKYKKKGIGYQKNNMVFNKQVTEERFTEIKDLIKYDILKDLKLELNKNSWSDEWKKVTNEQWKRILEIPEAYKKVIEKIIGFELKLDDKVELTIYEIADKFNIDVNKLKIKK
jgi:hypothetical protein